MAVKQLRFLLLGEIETCTASDFAYNYQYTYLRSVRGLSVVCSSHLCTILKRSDGFTCSAGAKELEPSPQIQLWGPDNGGLGAEPPAGSKGKAPGQGVSEAKPPEAETLLISGRSVEAVNLPTFQKLETRKIRYNLCSLCKKMKSNRPQYVTDYCTLVKSNRLVYFG